MSANHLQNLDSTETSQFEKIAEDFKSGIALIPQRYGEDDTESLHSASGDFVKWLKLGHPDINVHVPKERLPRVLLRNNEYWLPLIWLSSDVLFPVFLNLVSSYLYDKAKGALKGERPIVRVKAVYKNRKSGLFKKFQFEGNAEQLKDVMKQFNQNEFMNDDEK
jgi:hypothetical protein